MNVLAERRERIMSKVFLMAALMSIVSLALIIIFMFANGLPVMLEHGVREFLFGTVWRPTATEPRFGLLPMIIGSLYVTAGAAFFWGAYWNFNSSISSRILSRLVI